MLKKEIKSIFKAIRSRDLKLVKELVSNKPELVNVCNFAPPKKDDGQSPLQVAFKIGDFEITDFLITQDANVNFIDKSSINEWSAPVIHDCITAVVARLYHTPYDTTRFDRGIKSLQFLIENGASVIAEDSYGNNCLVWALLRSTKLIESAAAKNDGGIILTKIRQLFSILIEVGADPNASTIKRKSLNDFIKMFELDEYNLV